MSAHILYILNADIWIVWIDKVGTLLKLRLNTKQNNLRRAFENSEFTPLLYRITLSFTIYKPYYVPEQTTIKL